MNTYRLWSFSVSRQLTFTDFLTQIENFLRTRKGKDVIGKLFLADGDPSVKKEEDEDSDATSDVDEVDEEYPDIVDYTDTQESSARITTSKGKRSKQKKKTVHRATFEDEFDTPVPPSDEDAWPEDFRSTQVSQPLGASQKPTSTQMSVDDVVPDSEDDIVPNSDDDQAAPKAPATQEQGPRLGDDVPDAYRTDLDREIAGEIDDGLALKPLGEASSQNKG